MFNWKGGKKGGGREEEGRRKGGGREGGMEGEQCSVEMPGFRTVGVS